MSEQGDVGKNGAKGQGAARKKLEDICAHLPTHGKSLRAILEPGFVDEQIAKNITVRTMKLGADFLKTAPGLQENVNGELVTERQVQLWLKDTMNMKTDLAYCITRAARSLRYDLDTLESLTNQELHKLIVTLKSFRKDVGVS